MRVLLHICCGPCAIMPVRRLLDEGHEVHGFFFNPNIHPLAEYLRRRAGAGQVARNFGIPLHFCADPAGREGYDTPGWLEMTRESARQGDEMTRGSARQEDGLAGGFERCALCWEQRLERALEFALERSGASFDAFSTSLLYSRRQRHAEIAAVGSRLAEGKLPFLYRDFRPDWQEGIRLSKEWEIYRQQYCGCIFSENDRYAKDLEHFNIFNVKMLQVPDPVK
ncbi:MAG: epoxyqueuosine reductase QueH [Deltaproteobacteria bacterium]|jgi:predicted adenine nucleotide alpha hydrolase (AANH) superfamily ATPase|nr:epoxyqueuosine reductase QueH [Deltaproteobacteria bacterium]